MKAIKTPNGPIKLDYVQWVEPVHRTSNGYAFDVHLYDEVCHLAFDDEYEALELLDKFLDALNEFAS